MGCDGCCKLVRENGLAAGCVEEPLLESLRFPLPVFVGVFPLGRDSMLGGRAEVDCASSVAFASMSRKEAFCALPVAGEFDKTTPGVAAPTPIDGILAATILSVIACPKVHAARQIFRIRKIPGSALQRSELKVSGDCAD
jgi:hypothetical protein